MILLFNCDVLIGKICYLLLLFGGFIVVLFELLLLTRHSPIVIYSISRQAFVLWLIYGIDCY